MYKIHKEQPKTNSFLLPGGSNLLDVQYQGDKLTFWYMFSSDIIVKGFTTVEFKVISTGQEFNIENFNYFKTLQDPHGFVDHVFIKVS